MCQDFARFFKVLHVLQGFCRLLQVSTRFFRFLQGFSGFREVLNFSARFCRFLHGFAGSELCDVPREPVEAKQLYKTV